jgi:hypothetical protein
MGNEDGDVGQGGGFSQAYRFTRGWQAQPQMATSAKAATPFLPGPEIRAAPSLHLGNFTQEAKMWQTGEKSHNEAETAIRMRWEMGSDK